MEPTRTQRPVLGEQRSRQGRGLVKRERLWHGQGVPDVGDDVLGERTWGTGSDERFDK